MYRLGCFILWLALVLAFLLPIFFFGAMESALRKLGIPPDVAVLIVLGILIGSAINVPLWRFQTPGFLCADPLAILGLAGVLPHLEERRQSCAIAVNVGGCVIPLILVVQQIVRVFLLSAPGTGLVETGLGGTVPEGTAESPNVPGTLIAMILATAVNVLVCWKLARVVPGVGIALPGIVPGVVAAASALFLAADFAPPVAFVAGILGPLLGADILHLRDLRKMPVGLASIGGAGTFDGILLSAILAAFLS